MQPSSWRRVHVALTSFTRCMLLGDTDGELLLVWSYFKHYILCYVFALTSLFQVKLERRVFQDDNTWAVRRNVFSLFHYVAERGYHRPPLAWIHKVVTNKGVKCYCWPQELNKYNSGTLSSLIEATYGGKWCTVRPVYSTPVPPLLPPVYKRVEPKRDIELYMTLETF